MIDEQFRGAFVGSLATVRRTTVARKGSSISDIYGQKCPMNEVHMAHGHHIHPFRFQERAPSPLFPALAARLVHDLTRIPIDRNVYILPIKKRNVYIIYP